MAVEIRVPRLGWSMEEGTFIRWLKNDGEVVKVGDMLYELESEKSTQEIEALDAGVLRILADAPAQGTIVAVGALLGYLGAEGEDVGLESRDRQSATDRRHNAPVGAEVSLGSERAVQSSRDAIRTPLAGGDGSGRVNSSPRARRVATELGIDWKRLRGSGRSGRVRERDVRLAAERSDPANSVRTVSSHSAKFETTPISPRRKTIADRMVASCRQTAPVTLTTRADATNLVVMRNQFKTTGDASRVPTYTDIVAKLAATALEQHPKLAARWEQDRIVPPERDQFNIGIAVDTEAGLLVPVVRDVLGKSLARIAEESADLFVRARSNKLTPAEHRDGVFTITNLGSFGIDAFTPIINLPETSILGLGAIRREPVVLDDGQLAARELIWLSLTFDHRVVDGAPAARFLQTLRNAVENPSTWLRKAQSSLASP